MTPLFRISAVLAVLISSFPAHAQEKSVIAVMPFTGSTGDAALDGSAAAMAEYIRTELAGYAEFTPAGREAVAAVPGGTDAAAAAEKCGARFVVTGTFSGSGGVLTVSTRIYDAQGGRWYSEDVTGSYTKRSYKMMEILAYNIRHSLTGAGGYITTYQLRPGWYASMAIASGVSLFTGGVMYALYRDSYDNMYMKEPQSLSDREANFQKANSSFRASAVFTWTGAALSAATAYLLVSSYSRSNFITGRHGTPAAPLSYMPAPDGGRLTYTLRF